MTAALPDGRVWLLLAGCGLAGFGLAVSLRHVRWRPGKYRQEQRAVASFLAPYRQSAADSLSAARRMMQVDPDFIILSSLRLAAPRMRLSYLRCLGAALPAASLAVMRFPLLPALVAGALGYVVVDAWLKGRWHKFRAGVEAELPTFVSRLGAMLLVNESLTACLEEVLDTLNPTSSSLRVWMEGYLLGMREEGRDFLAHARAQASRISPSLALVAFQLERVAETGGVGFARAFARSAQELQMILEVRAMATAKAEGARNAIAILLAIMALVVALMASSPSMRAGYADPASQAILMGALGAMALGYHFLNGMIADVLE